MTRLLLTFRTLERGVDISPHDAAEDLDPIDPAMPAMLVEVVAEVDGLASRLQRVVRAGPGKGSRAESVPEARSVFVFATQARGSCGRSSPELAATCLRWTPSDLAQMTLVRAGLEGAVTARWLVDPRAAPHVRVGRGVPRRWTTTRSGVSSSYRRTSASEGATAKSAAARVDELKASRDAAALPVVRYPTTTWLMEQFSGVESDGVGCTDWSVPSLIPNSGRWQGRIGHGDRRHLPCQASRAAQ
jgi:hypothetical protein